VSPGKNMDGIFDQPWDSRFSIPHVDLILEGGKGMGRENTMIFNYYM
jgi:hypothetical protein